MYHFWGHGIIVSAVTTPGYDFFFFAQSQIFGATHFSSLLWICLVVTNKCNLHYCWHSLCVSNRCRDVVYSGQNSDVYCAQ